MHALLYSFINNSKFFFTCIENTCDLSDLKFKLSSKILFVLLLCCCLFILPVATFSFIPYVESQLIISMFPVS